MPDNVRETAFVCQIQADQTRDYWLRVIGDEFNRRVEEAELAQENMKSVMEVADTKKKAKPKKSDKD